MKRLENARKPEGRPPLGLSKGVSRLLTDAREDNPAPENPQGQDGWRIELGSIGKGRTERERVAVSLARWRGGYRLDVRTYVRRADGGTQPTAKGINIAIADLPAFLGFVEAAADQARALGILSEGGPA